MTDLKAAIRDVVVKGAVAAANNENIAIADSAVGPVADIITSRVKPLIEHAMNTEPWYRSRVTVGAIVSMGTGLLSALGVATDWVDPDTAVVVIMAAGSLVGGVFTLYGRWAARKPMGT